ncbi:Hypothetical Protein RRSL_01653 [Ralstonia solanacearum UW551]|uniref:Uncharacterized protein n=1 Tax=Ralstonia solanacearum (strain UW551) TaxID=342110 RepID=A0AB33VAZ5_RALSU|nr:Hypothetical Protein RRSL_01653 [Ralstonia solanacearum UW551]
MVAGSHRGRRPHREAAPPCCDSCTSEGIHGNAGHNPAPAPMRAAPVWRYSPIQSLSYRTNKHGACARERRRTRRRQGAA